MYIASDAFKLGWTLCQDCVFLASDLSKSSERCARWEAWVVSRGTGEAVFAAEVSDREARLKVVVEGL